MLKKLMATFAVTALAVGVAGCSSEKDPATSSSGGNSQALVGIVMPTKSLERWNRDGAHLEKLLKDKGYQTRLEYADNAQDKQNGQVENMINDGAKVIVVASIDGKQMGPVLAQAKAKGVKVIAYDRLINGTEDVDFYATFDNEKVGKLQGQFILDNMDKYKAADGKIYLEPFAGSPDDNNAKFFFKGAWDLLSPKVADGTFVVASNKAPANLDAWTSIGINAWKSESAQSEMETRLNSFYTGGKKVNVVLSPNDSLALGIEQALDTAGYKVGGDWPLVTGQDGDKANVVNMLAGKQSMTVWKDTRKLGDQVAKMVDQIIKGETVEVNDTKTYDNGKKVVPTFLIEPEVITKDTVQKMIDAGFYTKADLGL